MQDMLFVYRLLAGDVDLEPPFIGTGVVHQPAYCMCGLEVPGRSRATNADGSRLRFHAETRGDGLKESANGAIVFE